VGPDATIPPWILPADAITFTGCKPDFVIIKGWPAGTPPPKGPYDPAVKAMAKTNWQSTPVRLIIGEFAFCSDLYSAEKVQEKTEHYAPLLQALEAAGWIVDPLIVVTGGVRATVPIRNLAEFEKLGITHKKNRTKLQNAICLTAEVHLNKIIRQHRILRQKKQNQPTGIG
jgi:hypothetical protein